MAEEFAKKLTNAEELLRQVEGETVAEAIDKWWKLNGLDVEQARASRKAAYAKQKAELTVKNSLTLPN